MSAGNGAARSRSRRIVPLAVCTFLLLSSCTDRIPVAPETAARTPAPRLSVDAPTSLGSTFLGAPATSAPEDVQGVANNPVQFASAGGATWIVVRVSGDVGMQRNPECDINDANAPNWACMNGSVMLPFSSDPWHGGPVLVTAQDGPFTREVALRGLGGQSTSSAIGLHLTTSSGTLSARLNLTAQWAWNAFTGTGPFSFYLSGGYSVSATAVPSPLTVTEGPASADGTRTYTVAPIDGLQFRNPIVAGGWHFPAGTITWHFFPGDSVSTVPGWEGQSREISGCNFQPVCRYTPPGPGRVQVSAYVEGQHALARSTGGGEPICSPGPVLFLREVGCDPQARLALTCNDSAGSVTVLRGAEIFCEASTRPAGARLEITRWRFVGEREIVRPASEASEPTWSGTLVVSGSIIVEGKVNGVAVAPASVAAQVKERDWKLVFPAQPTPEFTDTALEYPPEVGPDGSIGDGVFGQYRGPRLRWTYLPAEGPNAGYVFVPEMPRFISRPRIFINKGLERGDPFYQAQVGPGSRQHTGYVPCGPADMNRFYEQTVRHEVAHYTADKEGWESEEVADFFEGLVKYDPSNPVITAADVAPGYASVSKRQDVVDQEKLRITCLLENLNRR